MSIRNNVCGIFVLFFILQNVSGQAGGQSLDCLNGTWVDDQQYLKSKAIHPYKYGWGEGKRIVETTLEIDMVLKVIQIPGGGKWVVEQLKVINTDTFQLSIRSAGGVHVLKNITFHFISNDKLWIEPPSPHEFLSVGKDNIWYRLSGPSFY